MKNFPPTPELLKLAQKLIWFQPPEESLADPIQLMTYAMTYACASEMNLLLLHAGMQGLEEAIDAQLPGIVDARSWAYWNHMVGRVPPPLPTRRLPH
jgi:hypothetical protein